MKKSGRTLCFRVSHREYEALDRLRAAAGARTISALIRIAANRWSAAVIAGPKADPFERLGELEGRVAELASEIDALQSSPGAIAEADADRERGNRGAGITSL